MYYSNLIHGIPTSQFTKENIFLHFADVTTFDEGEYDGQVISLQPCPTGSSDNETGSEQLPFMCDQNNNALDAFNIMAKSNFCFISENIMKQTINLYFIAALKEMFQADFTPRVYRMVVENETT